MPPLLRHTPHILRGSLLLLYALGLRIAGRKTAGGMLFQQRRTAALDHSLKGLLLLPRPLDFKACRFGTSFPKGSRDRLVRRCHPCLTSCVRLQIVQVDTAALVALRPWPSLRVGALVLVAAGHARGRPHARHGQLRPDSARPPLGPGGRGPDSLPSLPGLPGLPRSLGGLLGSGRARLTAGGRPGWPFGRPLAAPGLPQAALEHSSERDLPVWRAKALAISLLELQGLKEVPQFLSNLFVLQPVKVHRFSGIN
mmetsp:Transcript_91505/g.259178  ORF Transcript_91505/g.259178 Transcript_91505/m.259178 type:complete len:254 (-) Transcript_91505:371-1132(-)